MESIVVKFSKKVANTRQTRSLEAIRPEMAIASEDTAKTTFEVHSLDQQQRAELDKDPEYLVADKMDLNLIQTLDEHSQHPPFVPQDSEKITWGLKAVGADESNLDGQGVRIAVLDTGIESDHPAFDGVTITSKNFSTDVPEDNHGHGTHCAGTIFGRDVDGKRIGVARGVTEAFIAKVIPGQTDALINALNWAFENDVRVASMSLGIDFPGFAHSLMYNRGMDPRAATSKALSEYRANMAVFDTLLETFRARELMGRGMVIVAATGNESQRPRFTIDASPPSAAFGMIRVGAVRQSGDEFIVADFSNTKPLVVGPGVDVESAALGGGLVALSGTSMATPHVAGIAALHWQKAHPSTNATIVAAQLQANANNIDLSWDDVGIGMATAP